MISTTAVDRLGQLLRQGPLTESAIRELDEYRRSFGPAYAELNTYLRDSLGLSPTGRPAKSTLSIVEKLRRETIRLSQVQDIAGSRVVVPTIVEQDKYLHHIHMDHRWFKVVDRREVPSAGYRAVHIIPDINGKLVELQLRSALQHQWAEVSEKLADIIDPAIKYGGGPDRIQSQLREVSDLIAEFEKMETRLYHQDREAASILARLGDLDSRMRKLRKIRLKPEEAAELSLVERQHADLLEFTQSAPLRLDGLREQQEIGRMAIRQILDRLGKERRSE